MRKSDLNQVPPHRDSHYFSQVYVVVQFSLCVNILCDDFCFQKWTKTVFMVMQTVIFIIFQYTMNISSMHMGESPLLKDIVLSAGNKSDT